MSQLIYVVAHAIEQLSEFNTVTALALCVFGLELKETVRKRLLAELVVEP